MTNKPKAKGTGGETELFRLLGIHGLVRTPASSLVDLTRPGWDPAIKVLATRPDHGQWLFTMDLPTFRALLQAYDGDTPFESRLDIEVKRYKKFAQHTIFEGKFGSKV